MDSSSVFLNMVVYHYGYKEFVSCGISNFELGMEGNNIFGLNMVSEQMGLKKFVVFQLKC